MVRETFAPMLLACLVLLPGCGSDNRQSPGERQLAAALQQWNSKNIHDYEFTFTRNCLCPRAPAGSGTFVIRVEDDVIESAYYRDSGEYLADEDERFLPTIADLFDMASEAYKSDAEIVEARYDTAYGFPQRLYVDRSRNVADDEVEYLASGFTSFGE